MLKIIEKIRSLKKQNVEEKLINETKKWLEKLKSLKLKPLSKKGEEFIKNIEAYINDTQYFLNINKPIEAFEAIIWAWAWVEIGEEIGILDKINKK